MCALVSTLPPSAQESVEFRENVLSQISSLLDRKAVIMDVVYHPKWTLLLKEAEKAECPVIHGVDMLHEQVLVPPRFELLAHAVWS